MTKKRVIGIGETVLDILFKDDQPQKAVPGGSTFNSIVSLGRAGVPCAMVTEAGGDHIGDIICQYLQDNGVSSDYVCRHERVKSHISLAFLDKYNDANYIFYKDHASVSLDGDLPTITKDDVVLFGSFFAMLIAILGLVGFVRDETNRRSKEIAIRKINGATSADVHRLLVWDVLKFSLVMAAAGCVGSYFAATKMLQQFAERITLTPLLFIGAAAVVLLIAFAVVLLCCHRLAKTNPSQLLRNE